MALKLRDGVSLAETEYGAALLDEKSGQYFNLNPTGALILRSLLDGETREQAAEQLTAEYDVDLETAGRDIEELIAELEAASLTER